MEIKGSLPSRASELTTLLFDLDGTLVRMHRKSLELRLMWRAVRRFARGVPPWRFPGVFWAAAEAMQTHETSALNYDVLVDALAARSRWSREKIAEELDRFLADDFPLVADRIQPIPEARETLELARGLGHRVVLATNPVWPLRGVELRLAWGGLGDFRFDYVTHSQVMTRCKPSPAYYHELLSHLGADPAACLMIGNDPKKDLPAKEAGISTFLVEHEGEPLPEDALADERLDAWGTLAGLRGWLEGADAGGAGGPVEVETGRQTP